MKLIEKTTFINSKSKELIVTFSLYLLNGYYEIKREKGDSFEGKTRISFSEANEYYTKCVNETCEALQGMEVIYETRN